MKRTILTYSILVFLTGTLCAQVTKNTESCGTLADRDGNTYNTIQIGTQCWQRENMRTETDRAGNPITPDAVGALQSPYLIPFRTLPNNIPENVARYGYLYNYEAAMSICPKGWHLPTAEEFQTLMDYCNENYAADGHRGYNGMSLASTSGWRKDLRKYNIGKNPADNNQSGFAAMPAGSHNYKGGLYEGFNDEADIWTASPVDLQQSTKDGRDVIAIFRLCDSNYKAELRNFGTRYYCCSVRCLRDN